MGVTRIFRYSGTNITQGIAHVENHLSILEAKYETNWDVKVSIMYPKEEITTKACYIVKYTDSTVVLVTGPTDHIVHGNQQLEKVVKNTGIFSLRQTLYATGKVFSFGDFLIRVGVVQVSGEAKMGVLEVEFTPVDELCNGQGVISELIEFLDPHGKFSGITLKYEDYFQLNGNVITKKHSAIDLLKAVNALELN